MPRQPIPPIAIDDNGDVDVYVDIASACAAVEVYDVRRLSVFDAMGSRVRFLTRGYQVLGMEIDEDMAPAPDLLRVTLLGYLERVGPSGAAPVSSPQKATLTELLDAVHEVG